LCRIFSRFCFNMRLYPLVIGLLSAFLWLPAKGTAQVLVMCDSFPQLESHIKAFTDKGATVVINFWATWCKPCVEELPAFNELSERYANLNVKVILVNLDFKTQIESRLKPLLQQLQLHAGVLWLGDQDPDTWMPQMSPQWDGAIPTTFVIRSDKRIMHTKKFADYVELERFVRPHIPLTLLESSAGRK
jgi:thiol-disulfide isomerase/thioredoxin